MQADSPGVRLRFRGRVLHHCRSAWGWFKRPTRSGNRTWIFKLFSGKVKILGQVPGIEARAIRFTGHSMAAMAAMAAAARSGSWRWSARVTWRRAPCGWPFAFQMDMSADTPTRRESSSFLCMMLTTVSTPRMPGAQDRQVAESHGQISRPVWATIFHRCELLGYYVSITTTGVGSSSPSDQWNDF